MGVKVLTNKWYPWYDLIARWGLAAIFLSAGIPKLLHQQEFVAIIEAYSLLPDPLLVPVALLLPLLEIIFAIGLLYNKSFGLWGISALLFLFIGILCYALWMGYDIDCGCFGPEDPEHKAFAGIKLALVRDLAMFVPLIYALWFHRQNKKISVFQAR